MEVSNGLGVARHVLSSAALILAVGSLTNVLANKIKIPDIVLFLLAGMLLGPTVLNLLQVTSGSAFNQIIMLFGSCYILFDGGASIRLSVLKSVWITLVLLATAGVVITAIVTGLFSFYVLGVPVIVAALLGATIASTDPATLVPVFKQVRIRDRVAQTVMSESAFNDATGAIITFALLGMAIGGGERFSIMHALTMLLYQSALGILVGAVLGYLALVFIGHTKWSFLQEHLPLVTLMAVIAAYLSADNANASGYMAVFVFGIMIGNRDFFGFALSPDDSQRMEDFIGTTALIMRMFIFLLLGSQIDFVLLKHYFWTGTLVVGGFMLVARPLAVFLCAGLDRRARWTLNELLFMCWTRETGVIPAALAGILAAQLQGTAYAEYGPVIASVTFLAILFTILIQATSTPWLAKRLGLLCR